MNLLIFPIFMVILSTRILKFFKLLKYFIPNHNLNVAKTFEDFPSFENHEFFLSMSVSLFAIRRFAAELISLFRLVWTSSVFGFATSSTA